MCSAETLARRNCASILLHRQATALHTASGFKCKSCDRVFGSFQALGGHRASHNKLRLTGESAGPPAVQLSFHECRECRVRFPTGQALGGHMRRHLDYLKPKSKIHKNPILKSKPRLVLDLDLNFPPPVEDYPFLQLVL